MRKFKTILTLLILIVFSSNFGRSLEIRDNNTVFEALTPHAPISIDDDLDFIGYAFPGAGTIGDPYIIENFEITISSSYGIYIDDVTKYFVISDCYIANQNTGIYIKRASSGRASVINNTCYNNVNNGIYIEQSDESDIINNTCSNNDDGIFVEDSASSVILNNTCDNNGGTGLSVISCDTSLISGNVCHDNGFRGIEIDTCTLSVVENNVCNRDNHGIDISNSDYIEVLNNLVCDNIYGSISISNSEQIEVIKNICFNNGEGISIRYASTSEIMNNTCYDNVKNGIKIEDSMFTTVAFNNLTRDSLDIEEDMFGFYLTYIVLNNTINNLPYGFLTHLYGATIVDDYGQFLLVNCSTTTIENKECVSIKLVESPNCIILNNQIENGSTGVLIQDSGYTEVINNSILNQGENGISSVRSESISVVNNTIVETVGGGISVFSSADADIINNTIKEIEGGGISVYSSADANIVNNTIDNASSCSISSSINSNILNNTIDITGSFSVSGSHYTKIINNTLTLEYDFQTWGSTNLEIRNNRLYKGSFNLPWEDIVRSYYIDNNWVNDLPFGYFVDINDVTISNQYGQIYLLNCDRITINNQNMRDISQGILLNLCDNIIITDSFLQSRNTRGMGMLVLNSTSLKIINTTCDNFFEGIILQNTQSSLITQCKILNNYIGLEIGWGSNNNQITHNLIKNNTRHGIEISSDNNVIHHNNFIDNRKSDYYGSSQAQDYGTNNIWYEMAALEGNYWSDWGGNESYYTLDGGSTDPYPLGSEAPINIHEFSANYWYILICGLFLVVLMPLISKKYRN